MVSLKMQKRLAASVMKCGQRKVWLDPNEVNEISMANSRELLYAFFKTPYIGSVKDLLVPPKFLLPIPRDSASGAAEPHATRFCLSLWKIERVASDRRKPLRWKSLVLGKECWDITGHSHFVGWGCDASRGEALRE